MDPTLCYGQPILLPCLSEIHNFVFVYIEFDKSIYDFGILTSYCVGLCFIVFNCI